MRICLCGPFLRVGGGRVPTPDQTVRCSKYVLGRYSLAALAALSVWLYIAFADTATFAFDIPREDLALALNQIAQQSHIEISYSAELTRGKISPVLKGTYTPEQALKLLLKGSGLHVRRIAGGALVIEKEGPAKSPLGGHLSSERYEYAQAGTSRGQTRRSKMLFNTR